MATAISKEAFIQACNSLKKQETLKREMEQAEAERERQAILRREREQAEAERQREARLRREREQAEAERQREARLRREREQAEAERQGEARLRREREQRESSRNQISLPSGGYDINIPIFARPRFDRGNRDGSISSGRGGTRPVSSRVEPRRVRDTGILNRGNTGMMRFTGEATDVDLLNLRIH